MRSLLFLILTLCCLNSCKDDCGECFTPPQAFVFEILSKETNENLFSNGTYTQNQIALTNATTNNAVEFTFIDENDSNLIQIHNIGWKTEEVTLKLNISEDHIFDFYVDAERKTEDCCSFTTFNEIEIRETEFTQDPETGIYSILVD